MDDLWCINVIFNPIGYNSRFDNYHIFKERLLKQNINLLTIEMTFNDQKPSLEALQLKSNSIMWQKERMINYAISQLPDCKYIAWLDGDLLLPDGWDRLLIEKLQSCHFVQLFEKIIHLKENDKKFGGTHTDIKYGIVWQSKKYGKNWIPYRLSKLINHAEPGFAWAARKDSIKCLYDKLICGGGDNWLADCLLSSFPLHHYLSKLTNKMKIDMDEWKVGLTQKTVDYLPIDIYHLWHGEIKNRGYHTRDLIFKKHDFDPKIDVKIENNVLEWNSNKPDLHKDIISYFQNRLEDA